MHGLGVEQLRETIQSNNQDSTAVNDQLKQDFTVIQVEPISSVKPLDSTDIPLANIYATELSQTDYPLIFSNNITKVNIALALAREERDGWMFFSLNMHDSIDRPRFVITNQISSTVEISWIFRIISFVWKSHFD